MRNTLLAAAVSACVSVSTVAQITEKPLNEISIYGRNGLPSIRYQLKPTVHSLSGYAGDVGLGYTYFVHKHWGIHLGAEAGLYNVKKLNNVRELITTDLTDANNLPVELHTTVNYDETLRTGFLNIPLMAQFQINLKKYPWQRVRSFYAMSGVKASFPFKDKYDPKITHITNKTYYPGMNWAATQTLAGLGDLEKGASPNGKIWLDVSWMLALEAGLKWHLNDYFVLYTGAYVDYGLSNAAKGSLTPIMHNDVLRNNRAEDYYGIPNFSKDFELLAFTNRIYTMSAGISIRLAFHQAQRCNCPYRFYKRYFYIKN